MLNYVLEYSTVLQWGVMLWRLWSFIPPPPYFITLPSLIFHCYSLFVCLFAHLVQSWMSTMGPGGLKSPRDPFSTPEGDWDLYFS